MTTPTFVTKTAQLLKSNSPKIFTALGVAGVVSTSYLAAKATVQAVDIIRENEKSKGAINDPKQRFKERVQHTWRLYIPTAVSGTATVFCIVSSSRVGTRRAAAAVTAYSLSERAFAEYRDKVIEHVGEGKERKIRDEIAQDQINRTPMGQVIITGRGDILCCERYTGRYFRSDMEALKKAENQINYLINIQRYVPVSEFYDLIGLGATCVMDEMGWDSDKLMELKFSTVLSENGEPCLAFEYNYLKPL